MLDQLTNLKAEAAMRHVDMLIARKHRRQAEDRWADSPTESNHRAAKRAQEWADNRARAYYAALDAWNAAAAGAR